MVGSFFFKFATPAQAGAPMYRYLMDSGVCNLRRRAVSLESTKKRVGRYERNSMCMHH